MLQENDSREEVPRVLFSNGVLKALATKSLSATSSSKNKKLEKCFLICLRTYE